MPSFEHLRLFQKLEQKHKPTGGGSSKPLQTTLDNKNNPEVHANKLRQQADTIVNDWENALTARQQAGLPTLPDADVIPLFLKIDPNVLPVDALLSFGIHVISEEEDGLIIGAAFDQFKALKGKIKKFLQQGQVKGKEQAAKLWDILQGEQWRLDYILSEELKAKWSIINDNDELVVDVSIAYTYEKPPRKPRRRRVDTQVSYNQRIEQWKNNIDIRKDELETEREEHFTEFITLIGAEIISSLVKCGDSFGCHLRIKAGALKDFVSNYQYVFDVAEHDSMSIENPDTGDIITYATELVTPDANSPRVCVIDSGIQQNHKLLESAILTDRSLSFLPVPNNQNVADECPNGGHGTKVTGAILFGNNVPQSGQYKLPFFIYNARILNAQNALPSELYPPQLMQDIVSAFGGDARIFNLSVNAQFPCRRVHMTHWAATIDNLCYTKEVLFVVSAGNIPRASTHPFVLGIKNHLQSNRNYPDYLLEASSRIANPAQSCFSITVGSVAHAEYEDADKISFAKKDLPSAFTRSGPGLWGMVKPDVVEYGGDLLREKNGNPNLSTHNDVCPELVCSTLNGGRAVNRTDIGTSFAAPKVTRIAAELQRLFPDDTINLYRALIAQSARLPGDRFKAPTYQDMCLYGYGIPSLERATQNSPYRVSLYATDKIAPKKAHVYTVKLPESIRRQGDNYDILIEVTLSYTAQPRRTRRRTRSYLSTYLSWESSKKNESAEMFAHRVLEEFDKPDDEIIEDQEALKWHIRERSNLSTIDNIKRQDSTLQKSWLRISSFELRETISFAVIGRHGWRVSEVEEVPYAFVVSFEALESNIELYEKIRIENEQQIQVEVNSQ